MLRKGFKSSKCKTLLKLAMSRIKLLRNKRSIQVKQMRRDIALMLGTGQEPSARIRVEHVIREQNVLDAYDMIELFAELVVVRLPVIDGQKTCPADLKEAIASLIFAAARCADLPELADIKSNFALKYGKEFVAGAAELRPTCGVSRRLIEKMSVRAPSGEAKVKVLKDIANEYHVAWDASDTEAEFLKQPEDLLDGPQRFVQASELPRMVPENKRSSTSSYVNNARKAPSPTYTSSPQKAPPPPVPTYVRASPSPNSKNRRLRTDDSVPPYKDVAAAAQAAADSAEQAAAAARAVANLATRQVLQGLSEQILNAVPVDDDDSPRYKLKDYLNGTAGEIDSPVTTKFRFDESNDVRNSRDRGFTSPPSSEVSDDELTVRFHALKF